ncbi:hypothetical protein Taro_056868 [Colocasia esculenta]|uniref:Uncharacterized protein n=1 Tax=Colocasia esculenta TaxID=4460 RepID=A0A843XYN7_COLES|nr:hypothetical protein [Colocasia esculenta]
MIRPKLYKNLVRVVSTLDQVVSTPCSKPKTKSGKTGQVVSTLVQVVSTLETDSRTHLENMGQVSTLAEAVSTLEGLPEHSLGCFGTVCRH